MAGFDDSEPVQIGDALADLIDVILKQFVDVEFADADADTPYRGDAP